MDLVPLDKPIDRENLFVEYMKNMKTFLLKMHPTASEEEVEAFIKQRIDTQCKALMERYNAAVANHEDLDTPRTKDQLLWPTLQVVYSADPEDPTHQHSYGNYTSVSNESLLAISRRYSNKIISPSGTFYETTDKGKSFVSSMATSKKKARSAEKKLMLAAKNCNDKVAEHFHNNRQSSIKYKMNSLPGVFNSPYSLYSSAPNYNAITSIARYCIQTSYAHAERFLEGNFYFRNSEQAINFLVACSIHGPASSDVEKVLCRYKLFRPTVDDVYEFIAKCIRRYTFQEDFPSVRGYLECCSETELAFIFYMSNMKHIVTYNECYFRPWIDDLMANDETILAGMDLSEVDPTEIYGLDGDLVIVLCTFYNHLMPINPRSGNTITAYETLSPDYNRPDVAKKLVVLGKRMQAKFDEIQELFDLFTRHSVGIGYVAEHKNMFRDCTILSDTDSIIFTTHSWADWYQQGDIHLDSEAYNINALAVYWLSKANANILYHLSRVLGAVGSEMFILNMKNEFMMPIEILSSKKKHYASILKIQEGVFYNSNKLDIKGVGFRGSTLCRNTLDYIEWFIRSAIESVNSKLNITAIDFIVEVLKFERMIYDDLVSGHTGFLTVTPIREEDEYADADASVYFNFRLWEDVFGDEYGHIVIPTKCYVLPCDDKVIRGEKYRAYLFDRNPDLSNRLVEFLNKYPDKDITRIPINPQTQLIPEELREIVNYRSVIYSNCSPLYLFLRSFGINTGTATKHQTIFSDIYGWLAQGSAPDVCKKS